MDLKELIGSGRITVDPRERNFNDGSSVAECENVNKAINEKEINDTGDIVFVNYSQEYIIKSQEKKYCAISNQTGERQIIYENDNNMLTRNFSSMIVYFYLFLDYFSPTIECLSLYFDSFPSDQLYGLQLIIRSIKLIIDVNLHFHYLREIISHNSGFMTKILLFPKELFKITIFIIYLLYTLSNILTHQ